MNGYEDPFGIGQLTPPTATPTGGTNWDLIATLLGGAGQAFSARDPLSWQSQLGGLAGRYGQSNIFAKAMTKAGKERSDLAEAIQALAGGNTRMTPKGVPGPTSMKIDGNGEVTLGYTPDRDFFDLGPLSAPQGAGDWETGLSLEKPASITGAAAPSTGGVGGQDVFSPFYQALQGGSL